MWWFISCVCVCDGVCTQESWMRRMIIRDVPWVSKCLRYYNVLICYCYFYYVTNYCWAFNPPLLIVSLAIQSLVSFGFWRHQQILARKNQFWRENLRMLVTDRADLHWKKIFCCQNFGSKKQLWLKNLRMYRRERADLWPTPRRVGSGRVGSGRVGSGRVGSGRVVSLQEVLKLNKVYQKIWFGKKQHGFWSL